MDENKQEKKDQDITVKPKDALPRRLMWCAIYLIIAVMFVVGGYMVVLQTVIIVPSISPPPTFAPTPMPTPAATLPPEATPTLTPSPTPYVQHIPVRVYFTKTDYWSDVYPVDRIVYEDGSAEVGTVDSANDSAWDTGSAAPGEQGNCIISGHESFAKKKGVFSYLKQVTYGEEIVVELDNGEFLYYEVGDIQEFRYDAFPAVYLAQEGRERLTLITCKGDRVNNASITRVVVVCVPKTGGSAPVVTPEVASAP